MAKQTIGIGSAPNDGTGDPLRDAFDKANDNFTELYDADAALDTRVDALEAADSALDARVDALEAGGEQTWTPNFSDDGEVRIYASVAMTITQQATSGTGSVAYEKSTTAAPGTFSSTTSPATLQAGAWLKVLATGVSGLYAIHLERTA